MGIFIICAFVLGAIITYLILAPKLKETKEKNIDIDNYNQQLREENIKLLTNNKEINEALQAVNNLVVQKE